MRCFYPISSCALITWVGLVWMLLKLYGLLCQTVMKPEVIAGDGKLWSRYGRIFSNTSDSSSVTFFSLTSSKVLPTQNLICCVLHAHQYGNCHHFVFSQD